MRKTFSRSLGNERVSRRLMTSLTTSRSHASRPPLPSPFSESRTQWSQRRPRRQLLGSVAGSSHRSVNRTRAFFRRLPPKVHVLGPAVLAFALRARAPWLLPPLLRPV